MTIPPVQSIQNVVRFLTYQSSAFYGPKRPDSERFAFLDQLYDLGERNWDTGTFRLSALQLAISLIWL
jgi:hypothetical protein